MRYVRLYTDTGGETHFDDVDVPMTLEPSTVSSAEWLISRALPTGGVLFREVTVEHPDAPHVAPRRQFIVHLTGEAEVEASDGEVRRFGPGSVLLVEDVTGRGHTTRRVGDAVRRTLFIPLDD